MASKASQPIAVGTATEARPLTHDTTPTPPPQPHHTMHYSYFRSPSLDHFASGVTAGLVSTLALHPFDLIKTRLQVAGFHPQTGSIKGSAHMASASGAAAASGSGQHATPAAVAGEPAKVYRSSLHAARSLIKHEGAMALYKGLSPNLVGNTFAWGLYFYGYDVVKRFFSSRPAFAPVRWASTPAEYEGRNRPLNALEHIMAAAITGTCVSAMTNPLWVVKTRMFLDRSSAVDHAAMSDRGLIRALKSIYRNEGITGLYRGFVPGLLGVSHGAVQFMCYEELKKARLAFRQRTQSASSLETQRVSWSTPETITMSIISKTVASATTYPYQVVRSRMQASPVQLTVRGVLLTTWRSEGLAGFYRGLWVNLVKVMPAACTVFVVYEQMSGYMKRHATYPHP